MELEERVYLIKYKMWDSNGGSFRYATSPTYAEHRLYYSRDERDKFISKYLYLKGKDDMYFTDIECYYSNLTLLTGVDMRALINQI